MHLQNEIPPVEIVIDLPKGPTKRRCGPFSRKTGGFCETCCLPWKLGVAELPELPSRSFVTGLLTVLPLASSLARFAFLSPLEIRGFPLMFKKTSASRDGFFPVSIGGTSWHVNLLGNPFVLYASNSFQSCFNLCKWHSQGQTAAMQY